MLKLHSWPDYIIRKGCFLSGLLLASALILAVWADARPETFLHLRHYVSACQTSSAMVLAASLLGGIFLEDLLRKG